MWFTCLEYLEEVLPALLDLDDSPAPGPDKIIQVIVSEQGGGECYYQLGGDEIQVHRGVSDRQDLTLAFLLQDDLLAFVENKLDVEGALRSERLKVHGDDSLLLWMAGKLERAACSA